MDEEAYPCVDARAALKLGDWAAAKRLFEQCLSASDTPEAHEGLSIALWWLNEIDESHRERVIAYNGYRQRGDYHVAAVSAAWIAREQVFAYGNDSAMKGWFGRSARLIAEVGDCEERGWVRLYQASLLATPPELEAAAQDIVALARRFGDSGLETLAMANQGIACVQQSRIDEGLALIDEAMAATTGGEVDNLMAISEIFCVTLSACELAGDTRRAEQWYRAATEFAQQYRCSFLSAYCRTAYGTLLMEAGRWQDAESELTKAIELFSQGHKALSIHARMKLAELQVYEGRLEEAEILLAGYEDHASALIPLTRLYLARADYAQAQAVIEQAQRITDLDSLTAAPLLVLLIQVELESGNAASASAAADQLTSIARKAQSDLLLAQAELCKGRIKRHAGNPDALTDFRSALDRLANYAQSLLASRARLEMAYSLRDTDPVGAGAWANAALASLNRLGAARDAAEATRLLRDLGITPRRSPQLREPLTQRENEVLDLLAAGLSNREIAEQLVISVKTAEHHVSQILSKTGLRNRSEAAAFAVSRKLTG